MIGNNRNSPGSMSNYYNIGLLNTYVYILLQPNKMLKDWFVLSINLSLGVCLDGF